MRLSIRLCFALLSISAASIAQSTDLLELAVPRHAIKFSPGHLLLNYHPSVQLAYEHRIARHWTIQGEYGHILNISSEGSGRFLGTGDNNLRNRKGYKTKLEGRYYIVGTKRGRIAWYAAGELYYNHIAYSKETSRTEFGGADGVVTTLYRQRIYNEEKGLNLKYGFLWNIGPMLVDVNAGIGYRIIHYTKPYEIFDNDNRRWFDTTPREESRNTPGLAVGVRVGYRFPWRRPA